MEKQKVDQIITNYLQKLYGFAIKKSYSYEEAESLCSEIIFEVYQSLLKSEEVINIDGYIWRISEHTYSKYVYSKKKHEGISLDGIDIPYYEEFYSDDAVYETKTLRREIAFLSETRRKILYLYYFKNKSVSSISAALNIPEGTVKWHLNKAKTELKEGISMERKIGKLGLSPIESIGIGHSGTPGRHGGPEFYLADKINLNIVYSVYHVPKTKEEIAEELGMTLVYIENKINLLESNGFIVKTKGNKYTTYVKFNAEKYSLELLENKTKTQLRIAEDLVKEYVPLVRKAIADIKDVYIPSENWELFEAAAIFYGVTNKCRITTKNDLSRYKIKTTDGGRYIALVDIRSEIADPEYVPTLKNLPSYEGCGNMLRYSQKYPAVSSWSLDTRLCSRKGGWENNLTSDYEYLYELMIGDIIENSANIEKFKRLRERNFITLDAKPKIMIVKGTQNDMFDKIPEIDDSIKNRFADAALENALSVAKDYPPQMQDLIISWEVGGFIERAVALMVMDILYSDGIFKPLTEDEKVTSDLIMFSDILPEKSTT